VMSSLERVVEKLIEVRAVKCPYCGLKNTVKNPRWKHVKCKGCGHKINVGFAKQYVDVKKVSVDVRPKRLLHPIDRLMPESVEELRLVRRSK